MTFEYSFGVDARIISALNVKDLTQRYVQCRES